MTAVTATPTALRTRGWWHDALVFAGRNVQHIRQIPEKLLDVTVQPLMFVLLFSYVFGGAIAVDGGNYREYLIGGILIQTLAFGIMGPATSIATDVSEGVVDRFRSLPVARTAYLGGHFLSELAGLALGTTVLLGAGLVVGWRTHNDVAHLALAAILVLVFASAMVWLGTFVGLTARTPDAVMGVGMITVFPLTFVSNAFVPLESLPALLRDVALWNPVSVVVAAVRELFGNPTARVAQHSWPLDHAVPAAFGYCALLLVMGTSLAVWRYRIRTSE